ncbi:recombinase RecT [Paenibacillus lupini]|uniref:recombinase RecT n=1 Tax=Paenibacillus lupini TaxID=1450204 RepID=UPI0014209554|nr:recombinase RecT [Paenibacillus lupini]NIK24231.1 recombination protein RecT [Paenibacillus lupini]
MDNKNNQIQVASELNEIVQIGDFGANELMTMKETIGKDLTIPQFNLFMYQCNRMGLDPALKHAFPILYGGKLDSRVSYEGLLSLAKKSAGYQGVFNQVVCENEADTFEAETDDEGVIVKINHKVKFPRGKVIAAYSIAKREGHKPVIVLMDVMEVQKLLKGQNQKFWKMEDGSPDPDMFKKHVGFRSIKAQFDIASVVEENMESLNTPEGYTQPEQPTRKDITAEVNAAAAQSPSSSEPAVDPVDAKWKEVGAIFQQLGITVKAQQAEYIRENLKIKGESATVAELTGLIKIMKMQLESAGDELE